MSNGRLLLVLLVYAALAFYALFRLDVR